jgi:hypothetical protein
MPAFAGGPLVVGGPDLGKEGQPFIWNPANMPIRYRVDSGPLSTTAGGAVLVDNAAGLSRVQSMFRVWQNVPTTAISYSFAGPLLGSNGLPAGDVATVAQFNDVIGTCNNATQNPVVFDANGNLMTALGLDPRVIGFAGPCAVDGGTHSASFILSGQVVMNGKWFDPANPLGKLTDSEFNQAITHEIGHFSGLDHSQINLAVFPSRNCTSDLVAGLPLMFPVLICDVSTDSGGFPILSGDDAAWISKLYPNTQTPAAYGTISGFIFFADRKSQRQGVNVIARRVDDPATPQDESLRNAYSAVSGYLFTGNPGQDLTGDNVGGDRTGSRIGQLIGYYEIPVPPGVYTVEMESLGKNLTIGPLFPPVPLFGQNEFWNTDESSLDFPLKRDTITVGPGDKILNINIIENGDPARFDTLEDSGRLRIADQPFDAAATDGGAL